jgi:hypothetical protein
LLVGLLLGGLAVRPGTAAGQEGEAVALQIWLRDSQGVVPGERVVLQRLPEEEAVAPDCVTDVTGTCRWVVSRGLYQLLFARPLDDVSALAVAEGGLRGLGITVGDEDITYSFTFHGDGRVYFDAAPEAAMPSPIIPVGDVLHGGTAPTPTLAVTRDEPVEETPTPEPTNIPDTAVDPTSGSSWHLVLFIAGGLVIGGGLRLLRLRSEPALSLPKGQAWSRKKQTSGQKTRRLNDQATKKPSDQPTTRPNDEETPHA